MSNSGCKGRPFITVRLPVDTGRASLLVFYFPFQKGINMENSEWLNELSPKEKLISSFGVSKKLIKFTAIGGTILGLLTIVVFLGVILIPIYLFWAFYLKKAYSYALTSKRVIAKTGLINKKMTSVMYGQITDISVEQNFFVKMFINCGTLHINTAGGNQKEIVLKSIENPYVLKKQIYSIMEA